MKTANELEAELAALEGQGQQQESPTPEAVNHLYDRDEGWLWAWMVQRDLAEVMDETLPLSKRVQQARNVASRYKRECGLGYDVTDEDRMILAEVVGSIKTTKRTDGTVYRWIPGTYWT